jgi:hypothetical protein
MNDTGGVFCAVKRGETAADVGLPPIDPDSLAPFGIWPVLLQFDLSAFGEFTRRVWFAELAVTEPWYLPEIAIWLIGSKYAIDYPGIKPAVAR